MGTAEIIMFAIQAGLQLYGSVRKAFVDSTRGRSLTLPLPRSPDVDHRTAFVWFTENDHGTAAVEKYSRVKQLIDGWPLDDPYQQKEFEELYESIYALTHPKAGNDKGRIGQLDENQLIAVSTIRQWQDSPDPSPLQTIAGTIVTVAIDYFSQNPQHFSENSAEGRALRTFVETLEQYDFATVELADIAPSLMIAVVDIVSKNPELISNGEREQELIENVTRTLKDSADRFLQEAPATERQSGSAWLQLVARSVLKGGAETILANPQRFLDVDDANQAALITHVGGVVADLVLGEDKVTFRKVFSGAGMNRVVRAVFEAVAANPDILKIDNEGLKKTLVAVAHELAKLPGPYKPDMFTEVVRLVLEKSAENMDLIWGKKFSNPKRHLLVTATKVLLQRLAKKPASGSQWKPVLTPGQISSVLETVIDEIVDNPAWLIDEAGGESKTLAIAVEAILTSLRKLDGKRVSAEAGIALFQSAVRAIADRASFLDDLDEGASNAARLAITATLDAVFAAIFDPANDGSSKWKAARNSTLIALVEIGLAELSKRGTSDAEIVILVRIIRAELGDVRPFDVDRFRSVIAEDGNWAA